MRVSPVSNRGSGRELVQSVTYGVGELIQSVTEGMGES